MKRHLILPVLLLAGMAAEGQMVVQRVYHRIEERLSAVGARIKRKNI